MKLFDSIKKRLNKNRRKTIKKKATAGLELLAAGAILTGGSVIMECLTETTSSPSIMAQEVSYNADSRTALIKF